MIPIYVNILSHSIFSERSVSAPLQTERGLWFGQGVYKGRVSSKTLVPWSFSSPIRPSWFCIELLTCWFINVKSVIQHLLTKHIFIPHLYSLFDVPYKLHCLGSTKLVFSYYSRFILNLIFEWLSKMLPNISWLLSHKAFSLVNKNVLFQTPFLSFTFPSPHRINYISILSSKSGKCRTNSMILGGFFFLVKYLKKISCGIVADIVDIWVSWKCI